MLWVLVIVFGATLFMVVATHRFILRRRLTAAELIRARLSPHEPVAAGAVPILRERRASQLAFLNRLLTGKPATAAITRELQRAGSEQTAGGFILTSLLAAFVGWYIGSRFATLIGITLGALGAAGPLFYLRWQQGRRIKKFEAQLPECIDMLVNAMKAGYSLQAAMKFVGDEMPAPLGPVFSRFYDEQRLGVDVRIALQNMRDRMDTLDMRMFVTSLLIQRESGGNLSEIMTNLSTLMRERAGIRGQIDTLTAEPKLSATVLTVLPPALFLLFNTLNHDYMQTLYTTPVGRWLLVYGIVSTVLGYIVLRHMANIDILRSPMPLPLIALIMLIAVAAGAAMFAFENARARRAMLGRADERAASDSLALRESAAGFGARLADWIQRHMPAAWSERPDVSDRLIHAGFDSSTAPAVYGAVWIGSALVVPLIAAALMPRTNPGLYLAAFALAVAIGLLAPRAALDRLAKRRQERLRRGVPDALDMLVVCVEAGISLDAGILRVAKEMTALHPELADEFLIVNRRVNAGMPRERALHGLAVRTGLDELRGLASNMIQCERWGTSIATVLRVYAESLRRKRKQTAERKAATAPLKMLFPLGFFIFPSIFVVIIGPAMIKIYAMFHDINR